MPSRPPNDPDSRELERRSFKQKLATAISEEDDPLAVYDQFIQWTVKNYGHSDPNSGLIELVRQATRAFVGDPVYKTDLRYLKLWTLYATLGKRSDAIAIYANLLANDIGTSFSLLYEGYAALLEAENNQKDADVIYRHGIRRQARPLERLRKRYQEFQNRSSIKPSQSSSSSGSTQRSGSTNEGRHRREVSSSTLPSSSTDRSTQASSTRSVITAAESRYALMLAPPDPGRRPEKFRFILSLLFTKEGGEYSIQEARARSMGLLGKKWPSPPAETVRRFSSSISSSLSIPVDFNDDGSKSRPRKSIFSGAEPTVTINTRAALDDVFGIYNSPDRTIKTAPGSKYAPLKEVRLLAPSHTPHPPPIHDDQNTVPRTKTPTSSFRPFVDENAPSRTPTSKFTPFADENNLPSTTPRQTLSVKGFLTPASNDGSINRSALGVSNIGPPSEDAKQENIFSSKVFTPAQPKLAPLRDVFTDDHGKPQPKIRPSHERAKSHHDALSPRPDDEAFSFTPIVDENVKTPFKVFSRPPGQSENVFTPRIPGAAFTPFTNPKPGFTPFRDSDATSTPATNGQAVLPSRPLQVRAALPRTVVEIEDSIDEEQDTSQYEDEDEFDEEEEHVQYAAPPPAQEAEYEEGESYQEIPLGGRFGRFNVMTPITERTFEFTTSTRGSATPSERIFPHMEERSTPAYGNVFVPQQRDEKGAVIAAKRLEEELKEEDEDEDEEPLEPFNLSDHLPPRDSPSMLILEEKTGSLSLSDTLTLNSKFKPPNPCNAFDPPIMTTLLSRIPSDPHFYDLRDLESNKLDGLQKFAKKIRKTSGAGNTGVFNISECFSLELDGHRFSVSEKLGEGGFGAVFKARDVGARTQQGDEDDDDDLYGDEEDEDNVSMVALKVVKPRNLWEYHALRRLHSVLPAALQRSVVLPHALYAFRDESFLVLDLCPQGTLLNIVNNAVTAGVSQQGGSLDELLVMFFTIELLRLIEALHRLGFIHGDLKIDNCLLRLEDVPGGTASWSSVYQPSGEGGWSRKGLKVIDFGRTIDTRLFPSGQKFIAEWPTDDRDCFEARENKPWTFQTDYFGLVGIIYCMLFGKYIQGGSVVQSDDRYKISAPLKRYWQTDLWTRLFEVLLNPCSVRPDCQLPVSDEVGALRGEMEEWLQANCNRASGTLKGLLKKVEVSCYVR